MPDRRHIEALEKAVNALLARREPDPVDAVIAPLVTLARELQYLPRPSFKARLQRQLQEQQMATSTLATAQVQSVIPYIAVRRAEELMEFIREAFGAQGEVKGVGSQGGLHAEFVLDGSRLMIGGGKGWNPQNPERPTALHYYVRDVDSVYERAVRAGATSLHSLVGLPPGPVDQPYGDREASIRDVAGNCWYIATHLATGYTPPGMPPLIPSLHPRSSRKLIDFLHAALGAEAMEVHEAAGRVAYAKVRLGESVLDMGDAHGPFQPMPTTFFVNVTDVDTAYARATAAGAEIMSPPADAPHGSRVAAVRDPEQNEWYLAAPIKPREW